MPPHRGGRRDGGSGIGADVVTRREPARPGRRRPAARRPHARRTSPCCHEMPSTQAHTRPARPRSHRRAATVHQDAPNPTAGLGPPSGPARPLTAYQCPPPGTASRSRRVPGSGGDSSVQAWDGTVAQAPIRVGATGSPTSRSQAGVPAPFATRARLTNAAVRGRGAELGASASRRDPPGHRHPRRLDSGGGTHPEPNASRCEVAGNGRGGPARLRG